MVKKAPMSAHVTILRSTRGQATDGINLLDGHVKTTVSHVTACAKTTTDMAAIFGPIKGPYMGPYGSISGSRWGPIVATPNGPLLIFWKQTRNCCIYVYLYLYIYIYIYIYIYMAFQVGRCTETHLPNIWSHVLDPLGAQFGPIMTTTICV
jgi:hypothetical protein